MTFTEQVTMLHDLHVPIISLWQPWATWVIKGWKCIETRTHPRFECLAGKRIAIHASLTFDPEAGYLASRFLKKEQLLQTDRRRVPYGAILGMVSVGDFGPLDKSHSKRALIDCSNTKRWGLFLYDEQEFSQPIPAKGKQGIWYFKNPLTK